MEEESNFMSDKAEDGAENAQDLLAAAGQANAAMGDTGYQDALECVEAVAKIFGVNPDAIFINSTGVGSLIS